MKKNYDFSNAIKNPHANALKDGYTIVVEHKNYDEVITVKKSIQSKKNKNTSADETPNIAIASV